ncbi:MAG: hypothetical protein ACP5D7_06660 [Limnospira sp.]
MPSISESHCHPYRYFPFAIGIRHPVPKARSLLMFVYPPIWVGLWKISGERSLWYFSR